MSKKESDLLALQDLARAITELTRVTQALVDAIQVHTEQAARLQAAVEKATK